MHLWVFQFRPTTYLLKCWPTSSLNSLSFQTQSILTPWVKSKSLWVVIDLSKAVLCLSSISDRPSYLQWFTKIQTPVLKLHRQSVEPYHNSRKPRSTVRRQEFHLTRPDWLKLTCRLAWVMHSESKCLMALSKAVLSWRPRPRLLEPLTWLKDLSTTCTAKWPETLFRKTKRKEQAPIWREVVQRTRSALSVTDLWKLLMCLPFTSQELSAAGAEIATVILVRKTKAISVALLSLSWLMGLRWLCHPIWHLQQHPKSK